MAGDGWLIAGGIGSFPGGLDTDMLMTTEILINGQFQPGPDLPKPIAYHCMVTINQTHVFLTGGDYKSSPGSYPYNRESYIYSTLTQNWTWFSEDSKTTLLLIK